MKKTKFLFLSLLCLLMCGTSVSADPIKVGFTSAISGTTVAAPTVTTGDVSVAIIRGKQSTGSNKTDMYWGTTTSQTFKGTCERTQYNGATLPNSLQDEVWTGASFTIPAGKQLDITDIQVDIAGQDYGWDYKVELLDGDGTVMKTMSASNVKPKASTKVQAKASELAISLTGTAKIKVYYCLSTVSNNSKYMAVPELYLTGTLNTYVQTKYTKPLITVGDYDQPSGTYPVTLAVQNDEDGTINYKIGEGTKVTDVESGTVVAVPYGQTIVATVSGDDFEESKEASATMAGKPQLAAPTYKIEGFDFATQLYTVTLSAATGTRIYYTTDDWATYPEYTAAIAVAPSTTVKAQAQQNNMTTSENLVFEVPAAPADGTHTTPSGGYTDGMIFNAGAYTIPNSPKYIGGTISGSGEKMNNAIKMRISQKAEPTLMSDQYGFHLNVNTGYTINSISLTLKNNYDTGVSISGVFVDDDLTTNKLASPVVLPYGKDKDGEVITIAGIAASKRIIFTFAEGTEKPNQAMVMITSTYVVPVYNTTVTPDGYGTMYYEKELVCPAGTVAYTGTLNADNSVLTLTELEDGVIPARTPVVINGEGGLFTVGTTGAATVASSLQGTATAIKTSSITEGTVCVLGYDSKAGFYKYTGEDLGANKAYLVVPSTSEAKVRIQIADDETTGISNAVVENAANGAIFNLAGQKVGADYKGIVIKNGKKILVK